MKYALLLAFYCGTLTAAMAQPTTATFMPKPNAAAAVMTKELQQSMTPTQAWQKLKDGNTRFVNNQPIHRDYPAQVSQTAKGQYPYAVVLSCIDSRTSSEIVFDQGLGDIFNIRIAGNYATPDILGSMEFACKIAGAKLLVVVGHSRCGAVKGACDHVQLGNLTTVIKAIEPATDSVKNVVGLRASTNDIYVQEVAKKNVELAIANIRTHSPLLLDMEQKGTIKIVGAMYDVATGRVEFLNQ